MAQFFDVAAAKRDGMTDEQIKQIMSKLNLKEKPVVTPEATQSAGMTTQDAVGVQTQPAPEKKSFASKVGDFAIGAGKAIFQAPARFGDALGGAAGMVVNQKDFAKDQQTYTENANKYTQKAIELSNAGRKDEARQLFKLAQEELAKGGGQADERIAQAEIGKEDTVKGAVGTAAFFVPGGQASLTGRVASSALTGGMAGYGASEKGDEVSSVVGGAALGGAVPLAGAALSKVFNWVKPNAESGILKRAGDYMRKDATKIRQKPGVWGAEMEDAIQRTLDDLGVTGTPQQKYELLAPKMEDLGTAISADLRKNPSQIPLKDILKSFKNGLKSSIRTSDLSSKTAQKEIEGYLSDLYQSAGHDVNGAISNEQLFALKKLVNEDYGGIVKKLSNGTPLNDREKVIQVARQVFDDIIAKTNPEVKQMTVMQSHLYDAANSLARARDAVPTTRIAGTTVPTPIIRGGEDMLGAGLQGASGKIAATMDKVGQTISSLSPLRNPAIAAIAGSGEQNADNSQQQQETVPNSQQANGNQDNSQQNTDHAQSVPQGDKTVTGYTIEQLGQALTAATLAGDKQAVSELKQLYSLESDYQKQTQKSATATKAERLNSTLEKSIDKMESLYFTDSGSLSAGSTTTGVGGVLARTNQKIKGATNQDFADRLTSYNQMKTLAIGIINKAREAGVLNAGEFEQMMAATPNEKTSEKAAKDWFKNVKDLLVNSPLSFDDPGMTTEDAVLSLQ